MSLKTLRIALASVVPVVLLASSVMAAPAARALTTDDFYETKVRYKTVTQCSSKKVRGKMRKTCRKVKVATSVTLRAGTGGATQDYSFFQSGGRTYYADAEIGSSVARFTFGGMYLKPISPRKVRLTCIYDNGRGGKRTLRPYSHRTSRDYNVPEALYNEYAFRTGKGATLCTLSGPGMPSITALGGWVREIAADSNDARDGTGPYYQPEE